LKSVDTVIIVVFDSAGIGELPDAGDYGDTGANTLGNVSRAVGGLDLPNLRRLGLGNVASIAGVDPLPPGAVAGAFGRMAERAAGKDTTTGHWEIAGLVLEEPFRTYPDGFPDEVIREFERRIGRRVLGNVPASGTVIIQELGDEHVRTGRPIVYTSADSVFQVAAHEDVVPVDELYRICRIAREIMMGPNLVGRVIARPFAGESGSYVRTPGRRDFGVEPPGTTLLDALSKGGVRVTSVGKISDIFSGRGISRSIPTKSNREGLEAVATLVRKRERGLIFANLIDFDMLYGHRNDAAGYARALGEADSFLPKIIDALGPRDVLAVCADHGCDPTAPGTDHTREYVPVLVSGPPVRRGVPLGTRESFADLGATVAELFGIDPAAAGIEGKSFAGAITGGGTSRG